MDLAKLRSDLDDRRVKLQRRVERIERDLRRSHDADSQERATERLNEPVLEALDEHVLAELDALGAAIERIDTGNFGQCLGCGGAIDEARLIAVPAAARCFSCAAA
jgi:RNA polymerase-binding transcription factor DksA